MLEMMRGDWTGDIFWDLSQHDLTGLDSGVRGKEQLKMTSFWLWATGYKSGKDVGKPGEEQECLVVEDG